MLRSQPIDNKEQDLKDSLDAFHKSLKYQNGRSSSTIKIYAVWKTHPALKDYYCATTTPLSEIIQLFMNIDCPQQIKEELWKGNAYFRDYCQGKLVFNTAQDLADYRANMLSIALYSAERKKAFFIYLIKDHQHLETLKKVRDSIYFKTLRMWTQTEKKTALDKRIKKLESLQQESVASAPLSSTLFGYQPAVNDPTTQPFNSGTTTFSESPGFFTNSGSPSSEDSASSMEFLDLDALAQIDTDSLPPIQSFSP